MTADNKNQRSRCVTLTLTETCNLSCVYCYENNKSDRKLNFDTAKDIILKEFADDTSDEITFELFGGEPFCNFDLIKKIVTFIKSKSRPKKYRIFITSNGTLVDDEIKQWLIENRNYVVVGLSLDGNREMHNINRSNSFDDIDIDFFQENYPNQTVKMTISHLTLPNMAEGVIYLHEKGFRVHCNFAYGLDWSEKSYQKTLYMQLKKLVDYYLYHPSVEPCSMLNYHIEMIHEEKASFFKRWCGTGFMHTYDVNGDCYPCQFFMPISMGNNSKKLEEVTIPREIPIDLVDSKCRNCPMSIICPTCYGANYAATGNFYRKDDNYCILMKISFLANSYYRWKLVKEGYYDKNDTEKLYLLRGISIIQKNLQNDSVISKLRE